jgi:uncharacterized membrane protein
MKDVKIIAIRAVILIVLDAIFIYAISKMFSSQILEVQHSPLQINKLGALFAYVLLIFVLYYFILRHKQPIFDAFLLGIAVYGVYEGTSLALLKKWRWTTLFVDTLWGGTLFASTTYLTYLVNKL